MLRGASKRTLPALEIGEKKAKLPIVQGQMAYRVGLDRLAGAVAAEGGVGLVTATGLILKGDGREELVEQIREARKLAGGGVVGVGVMYAVTHFDALLQTAIDEKVDLVVIGAGFAREPFNRLAEAGIPAWAIISSEKAARIVARLPSITGVVVESGEAGGHLGPRDVNISTWDLFPPVYQTLREGGFRGPVVAAGGIRYGWEIERALAMGAAGVQLGTLFAMTTESDASPEMKEAWVRSQGTKVIEVSPVGMPGRVIAEQSLDTLPRLIAPGVGCVDCLKFCEHRDDITKKHCIHLALHFAVQGKIRFGPDGSVEGGLVFSGSRVGEISDIVPTARRIQNLLAEMAEGPPSLDSCVPQLLRKRG